MHGPAGIVRDPGGNTAAPPESVRLRQTHGLKVPDAFILATDRCADLTLATRNSRDFPFERGVVLHPYRLSGAELPARRSPRPVNGGHCAGGGGGSAVCSSSVVRQNAPTVALVSRASALACDLLHPTGSRARRRQRRAAASARLDCITVPLARPRPFRSRPPGHHPGHRGSRPRPDRPVLFV
jgi:hypothetical protein